MEKLLFYTGTVLLIIAIILILFAIVAVFKNKITLNILRWQLRLFY